jgi:carbonic anhydrase
MALTRRSALIGLLAFPSLAAATRANGAGALWSHEDPERWARDPAAEACASGAEQSPIDLAGAVKADIQAPVVSWKPQAFEIVNDGHMIRARAAPGGHAAVGTRKFALQEILFHTPSEHAIEGQRSAMEAQFLHAGENGEMLAIAVLMIAGAPNKAFSAIMDAAPKEEGEATAKAPIDAAALLPKNRSFYRYKGSLTTPPCSELVEWNVFATPVPVSPDDITAFEALYPMNARPLQPIRRRFVLRR